MSKPRWQRALISFGGPLVNLLVPIPLLGVLFVVIGVPYPAYFDRQIQVSAVSASAPAESSPLQAGDTILSLNGVKNPTWEQALHLLSDAAPGSTLQADVENAGVRRTVAVPVKDKNPEYLRRLFGAPPKVSIVEDVPTGMPAYRAGIRPDDKVLALNGQPIRTGEQFVAVVRDSNGRKLALRFERKGQVMNVELTPQQGTSERGEKVWQVGMLVRDELAYRRVGIAEGTMDAALTTLSGIEEVVGVVGKLFSGRVSVRQLQGVVGIAQKSGEAVNRGPSSVLQLMALISINLGVLNLLPIPILDGGHILLLAIEGLRRRDLSMAFKERFVQVGLLFLLVLFAFVMYNDVARILPVR